MLIQKKCGSITFRMRMTRVPCPFVVLIILLLVSGIIWFDFYLDQTVIKLTNEFDALSVSKYGPLRNRADLERQMKPKFCPIRRLRTSFDTIENNSVPLACRRIPPVPGSCDLAKEIFESHSVSSCSFQEHNEYCQLHLSQTSHQWEVLCNSKAAQACKSSLLLGLPSPVTGELVWQGNLDFKLLEGRLTEILQKVPSSPEHQHFGFAFIKCNNIFEISREKDDHLHNSLEDDSSSEQLLVLPPKQKGKGKASKHTKSKTFSSFHDLNINIILVDSVSRQHFFRSLPKSVAALDMITSSSSAGVFDFQLFQAIKSRTFETLQAIFSGSVNVTEPPFGTHDIPPKPLNLAPIFKTFQDRGYRTLWLEDLCYLWEWGISKDLHFLDLESKPEDTWSRMWSATEKNGIESVAITLSMCRILEANKVRDHFHGPEAVCFNGKHQHEYLLDYVRMYQQEMTRTKQSFLTVTCTNVGHEDTGRRIQTLDSALADYLAFTPSLENTISIIFSDHGNAYGQFFEKSSEAQVELYHPFMFFIVPESASHLLGKSVMNNLKLNTFRLVTALDLHYTLAYIANHSSKGSSPVPKRQFNVSEQGLFQPVDPGRSCNSVPRIRPNVCICQNFNSPLNPSSFVSLFAHLAVGLMNEEIQQQYRKSLDRASWQTLTAFGNCQPLYVNKVTDIKESRGYDGHRVLQMNIHVQQFQVFVVSIVATENKKGEPYAVLETVTRITQYSLFSSCSDPTVDLTLCICDLSSQKQMSTVSETVGQTVASISNVFQRQKLNALPFLELISNPLKTKPCLHICGYKHKDGTAVFSINECRNAYKLKIAIISNKQYIYYQRKEEVLLLSGGVSFIGLVVSEKGRSWDCSLHAEFHLIS